MSFSVTFIGKPAAIKRKLEEESARLTGQSKAEFDAVRPALDTILDQNVGNSVVQLHANGHATFEQRPPQADAESLVPVKTFGSCNVDVKVLGQLAE